VFGAATLRDLDGVDGAERRPSKVVTSPTSALACGTSPGAALLGERPLVRRHPRPDDVAEQHVERAPAILQRTTSSWTRRTTTATSRGQRRTGRHIDVPVIAGYQHRR
jgi:hypothetical protein